MMTRMRMLASTVAAVAVVIVVTGARAWSVPLGGPSTLPAPGPREVLIIRTAEEPKGSDVHLSEEGKVRAKALATWIPATYGKPTALFASHATDKSKRAAETLSPIAGVLRLKVQDQFANDDYAKLAEKLLKESEFEGKTILICWTKGNIANLAKALGARQTPAWPDGQYDHVWRLQFGARGVTLEDVVQKLPSPGK